MSPSPHDHHLFHAHHSSVHRGSHCSPHRALTAPPRLNLPGTPPPACRSVPSACSSPAQLALRQPTRRPLRRSRDNDEEQIRRLLRARARDFGAKKERKKEPTKTNPGRLFFLRRAGGESGDPQVTAGTSPKAPRDAGAADQITVTKHHAGDRGSRRSEGFK